MAALQSLGLHEPSALAYLISESILPIDPPASSYRWSYQCGVEKGLSIVDEIVTTSTCAIWTRNAVTKRVFDLDAENEPVLHAFITQFRTHDDPRLEHGSAKELLGTTEPALVVVLRTQAHIFLQSGGSHVVPLAFEVQAAFACAYGFVLQRRIKIEAESNEGYLRSSDLNWYGRDTRNVSNISVDVPHLLRQNDETRTNSPVLPRTYSFTEILSELGLVVAGSSRKAETLADCSALPLDEDLLYISSQNELCGSSSDHQEPIYLAVTINVSSSCLNLWHVVYEQSTGKSGSAQPGKDKPATRRKSSNIYGRQPITSALPATGTGTFRESFGGLAQSMAENVPLQSEFEKISKTSDDFAAHLGHEFEQVGIQTRSARRVSSMLARTDLGGTNDRSAFNDIAFGTSSRKSLSRSVRRAESLGGFSDRQSFGRRRSSFQAASSIMSEGTSFLDLPAVHVSDEAFDSINTNGLGTRPLYEPHSNLPRTIGFMKLKSLTHAAYHHKSSHEQQFEVSTMLLPDKSTADDKRSRIMSVYIMDRATQEMITVNLALKTPLLSSRTKSNLSPYELKVVEVHRQDNIIDACRISEGSTQRLVTLTRTRDGQNVVHLEAPWSPPFRVMLPKQFSIFDPAAVSQSTKFGKSRDTGLHRVVNADGMKLDGLRRCQAENELLFMDGSKRCHRVRVQLVPSDSRVSDILDMANLLLPPELHDSLLVAWWEVKRWLPSQGMEQNLEWTSLTTTLFLLAVPFLGNIQNKLPSTPRRKKAGVPRSSSGTVTDLSHWDMMLETENTIPHQPFLEAPSWQWIKLSKVDTPEHKTYTKQSMLSSSENTVQAKKYTFLCQCANLARDFLQSPAGESATGTEGYLPTAVNQDRPVRRKALASILIGLHLLREEQKLHIMNNVNPGGNVQDYGILIVQLATWLRWDAWEAGIGNYYATELPTLDQWLIEISHIELLDVPAQPFGPPSIFQYVEDVIMSRTTEPFLSLLDLSSYSRSLTSNHPLWKEAARLTPRLFALTSFLSVHRNNSKPRQIMTQMIHAGISEKILLSIPDGVAAVCNYAVVRMRSSSPTTWPTEARCLIDRRDMVLGHELTNRSTHTHLGHNHDAIRDFRTIGIVAVEADNFSRWDVSFELDRHTVTRMIFDEDRRFQEASKLVNQTRPPVVQCLSESGWSESELLEAQKELAQHVTRRTLSVPAGRGMMHFNVRIPLLTERVPIPAFSLQCIMKARNDADNQQAMTFSADKAVFTEDKTCWAFFHNGASAGLMISRNATWIDTSWILYNKPPELTNRHAGFLLALGLNGHLKSLAKWVAFKYLTPKHTMISVGLLLGLAASYIGTMDTLVTRLLSVHVTRLLPPGAAELNLSPLTQTTGLLGIGLLYINSQHRRMSEVMLSEIENNEYEERSGDEPILRDEGYRLAAGFSLGLINLGQGRRLHSLHDMGVVERLLTIAIGTKNVNHVHVLDRATAGAVVAIAFIFMKTNDEAIAAKIDIPDTIHQFDYVRPDIFLLRTLARHLIMWDKIAPTQEFIQLSLPPVYRKRANLSSTKRMSTDDLPFFNVVAGICFAMSLRFAGSHNVDVRDLLIAYLDQLLRLSRLPALSYDARVTLNGIRNCLDIVALSCATVMAGSGDLLVMRRLRALHGRTDKDTPFGSHLAAHMALGALFLSGGTATFSTSNLAVASLVIAFYPVFPMDVLDNRSHLQAFRHLWVLAVDMRCLVCRDIDSGQLIGGAEGQIELLDGKIATLRSPGLLPELDTVRRIVFNHEGYWNIDIDLSAKTTTGNMTLREMYKQKGNGIQVFLQRRAAYEKPETDIFMAELQALDEERGVPSVNSNAAINEKWNHNHMHAPGQLKHQNPLEWVFGLESFEELDHAAKALILDDNQITTVSDTSGGSRMLKGTTIDSRLEFEKGCLGPDYDNQPHKTNDQYSPLRKILPGRSVNRDKLWQLRLLFAWADKWEQQEEEAEEEEEEEEEQKDKPAKKHKRKKISPEKNNTVDDDDDEPTTTKSKIHDPSWMKKEVIEKLRWRAWKMASAIDDEEEAQQEMES